MTITVVTVLHVVEGYHIITSSAWRNEVQASVGGVGLFLCREAKNSLCNAQSYSSRVLCATFSGNSIND